MGKTKNNYTQTSQIGEQPSKDGRYLSIQLNTYLNYLPKNYLIFSSYEYISYNMREKHNILFGTKRIFNIDNNRYLTFYGFPKDELEKIKELSKSIRDKKLILWLPEQIKNEFERNREKYLVRSYNK